MSIKILWHRKTFFFSLVVLIMIGAALLASASMTNAAKVGNDATVINWRPAPQVSQSTAHAIQAATAHSIQQQIKSIPYWASSFTYKGHAYPYTMVGTNPAKGSATTIIHTSLIPVKIVLANKAAYDGRNKVKDVLNSPLFQTTSFKSGRTQYGDAIQRAEFWKYVSTKSPSYHVLLTVPAVLPPLIINVPANMGHQITRPSGVVFGGIDINFLDSRIMAYMQAHHVSPQTLPIFLAANVLATDVNGTVCCIGGYHNAVSPARSTTIQTYAYATYNDPGFSLANKKVFTTTDALSHEISEWYNDPFGTNSVPNWSVASAPQYGCNNSLEVGDPLVGTGFDVGKYHLQDEAFLSWFSHQAPSLGINGRYSYLGTFTTPSKIC